MADKIDVARLVDEAIRLADEDVKVALMYEDFDTLFNTRFVRLVMEECAKVCEKHSVPDAPEHIAAAIRARMP
jgi:hypothetical protein